MGCGSSTREITPSFTLPEELKECKIHQLQSDMIILYVVACAESITTIKEGKQRTVITVPRKKKIVQTVDTILTYKNDTIWE